VCVRIEKRQKARRVYVGFCWTWKALKGLWHRISKWVPK